MFLELSPTFNVPRVSRPVDGHLDALAVDGGEDGAGVDGDGEVEALAPARSPNKSEVGELGAALHDVCLVVPQLGPVVLVVTC